MGRKGKSKHTVAKEQKERMRKRRQQMSQDKSETKAEKSKVDKSKDESQVESKVDKSKVDESKVKSKIESKVDISKVESKDESQVESKVDESKVKSKVDKSKVESKDEPQVESKVDKSKVESKVDESKVKSKVGKSKVDKLKVESKVDESKVESKLETSKAIKTNRGFQQSTRLPQQSTGLSQQPTGLSQQPTGLSQQPTGFSQQSTGFSQQSTMLSQQSTGLSQQPTGLSQQSTGFSQQSTGFSQQSTGLSQQSTGFSQQSNGLSQQSTGFSQQSTGLSQQSNGLSQQSTGFSQQLTRLSQQSTGFSQQSTGLSQQSTRLSHSNTTRLYHKANEVSQQYKENESVVEMGTVTLSSGNETDDTNYDPCIRIQGSFHQGNPQIFRNNAGKQCVANCFVAIACSKIKPLIEWNSIYLDHILFNGNELYSHIHGNNDLLLVNDVPNTIDVFDSLVQFTKMDPINAILGTVDPSFPCSLSLDMALQTALIDSDGCFISVNGFTSLAIKQNGHLYLFDSHSRDLNGRSDFAGSSITIHLDSINHLYDILRAFVNNNRNCIFEITGVKVDILACPNINSIENVELVGNSETTQSTEPVHQQIDNSETTQDIAQRPRQTNQSGNSQNSLFDIETESNVLSCDSDIEMIYDNVSNHAYEFKPLDYMQKRKLCTILKLPNKFVKFANSGINVHKMGTPNKTKSISTDGNCLFRAISYAICQRQEFHEKVRQGIIKHLLSNQSIFKSFLQSRFQTVEEHVNTLDMLNNNVWGTALEIIAAADLLKTDIYTFFNGSWIRYSSSQVCSSNELGDQSIYLKHDDDINHYEVVLSVNQTNDVNLCERGQNDVTEIPTQKRHFEMNDENMDSDCYDPINSLEKKSKKDKERLRYHTCSDFRNTKKLKSREKYETDEEYRISLKRKHDSDVFREKSREQEKVKYNIDDKFRHQKRLKSQQKYACNENHRNNLKQASKEKYLHDEEHKTKVKQASKEKYLNVEEHKSKVKQASKEKYLNVEEHKSKVKQASKEKYLKDEEHKTKVKQASKQKYAHDEAHRDKIREQTISRRNLTAEKNKHMDSVIDQFKKKVKEGPDHVCSCCFKLYFENQVIGCKQENYINKESKVKAIYESCVSVKYLHRCTDECENDCLVSHTSRGSLWICYTCHRKILKGEMPGESFSNNLLLEEVPVQLSCLNSLEQHLIALEIPFIKILALPKGRQKGVHGPVVCVPSDLKKITTMLPRSDDDNLLFRVKLKRKLEYKGYEEYKLVSSKHLRDALYLLKDINKWFDTIDIDEECLKCNNDNNNELNQETDPSSDDVDQVHEFLENQNQEKQEIEQEDDSYLDDGLRGVQLDTCLQPADIGQEALDMYFDKIYNISPAEGNKPVSVLQEEGLEAKTFPVHYPSGKNTFDEEREKKLSLLSYFKLRLMSVENRFARDTSYLFFCQYLSELDKVLSNVQISLRKNSPFSASGEKINSQMLCDKNKLKGLFKKDEAVKFLKPVRGTPPYWQNAQKDIFAMIRQLGIPTFFCSFSSADFRWTEIVETILKQQGDKRRVDDLDWKGKCEILCSNPVTVARMFEHRFQTFLKNVIFSKAQPIGKIVDYFYRVEFQQRGSPHTHCLFWVEDAPKFGEDSDEDVVEFVDKYITCKIPDKEKESELHDIVTTVQQHSRNHSKSCRKKGTVCRFNFPRPPSERTFILKTNIAYAEDESNSVEEEDEKHIKEKIALLWDGIQQGEETSTTDLFQKVGITQEELEKCLATTAKRNSIELKRHPNEVNSNQYNPDLLRAWNANMDIQYVLDAYSCVVYIISYISKAERELGLLLQQTKVEAEEGNLDAQHTLKKIGTAYLHHREISAQEAVFRVIGLKLKECSRKVQFIPVGENPCRLTKPLKEIENMQKSSNMRKKISEEDTEQDENEESIWMTSIVDRYKERPILEVFQKMCLASFCSEYNVLAESQVPQKINEDTTFKLGKDMGFIRKRTKTAPAVIRYPRFSLETSSENYYQCILQLFLPYRRDEQLKPTQFETYESFYLSGYVKFEIDNAPISVRKIVDENMFRFVKDEQALLEAEKQLYQQGEPEDAWAQLCPETEVDRRECMEEGSKSTTIEDEIGDTTIPDLNVTKTTDIQVTNLLEMKFTKNEILPLLRSLNTIQRQIFYQVRDWCIKKANGTNPDPFYALVTGGGGTGKSHLIKCLYFEATRILAKACENPDDLTVLLTAPTGTAAFNINGMTIHSALGIFKSLSPDHASLSEDKINTLRSRLEQLQILIIDEISMVNKRLLFFIHERLRQVKKTREDCPYGGVSIIAVGDFLQLPPVKTKTTDKLYINDPSSPVNHLWHGLFSVVELQEVMRQKGDGEFAMLLNRLRERKKGEQILSEDLMSLKECIREGPNEALHIFPTNSEVHSFNNEMVMKVCSDPQIIEAEDYEKNKTTGKLQRKKCHFPKIDIRLPQSILLAEGARVMLIRNEDIKDGLVNGVMGTVMSISEYTSPNLPSFIYIHFDNEKVGKNHKFQKVIKGKRCVGLKPSVEDVPLRNGTRKQFPLQLSWACTIHKVQGLTVKECVVDLNKCFSCGQAYVALSRVTSKQGLYIHDIEEKKITQKIYCDPDVIDGLKSMKGYLRGNPSLHNSIPNVTIMYHNIQGLNAHITDLKANPDFKDTDYICLTETWLESNSNLQELENYRCRHISRFDAFESTEPDFRVLKELQHGGVCVFHKSSCSFGEVDILTKNLECIVFTIPEHDIIVMTVYRTQKYPVRKFLQNFQLLLERLQDLSNKIIVMGDFNQDILKGEMSCVNFMAQFGFQQCVKEATTEGGTLIDHVYVRGQIDVAVSIVPSYYSYHDAVSVVLGIK